MHILDLKYNACTAKSPPNTDELIMSLSWCSKYSYLKMLTLREKCFDK